jgi:ABC-type Mn2+/Zn2+ transport system permease subunit
VLTSLGGFLVSLQWDMPVGSSIIIVSASTLAVAIVASPKRRKAGLRGIIPRTSAH